MSSAGQNGWEGFVSVTVSKPIQLTIIVFYPVIKHPITDYITVQECLHVSQKKLREILVKHTP